MEGKTHKTVIIAGYSCNNRCIFCCNEDKREKYRDKSTAEIKSDMLNAREHGSTYLELIGGEPTIRRDIIELVEFAKMINFDIIMFSTNGRMFSYKKFAEKIIDAGLNSVVFSIHGHTPKLHDSLTMATGSFNQLVKGIENVRNLGIKNVGSNTTISKQNYKFLPKIGNFINDLNFINAEFIFVDPTHGAPKNNFFKIVPKISEIAPYVHKCLDIGKGRRNSHWQIRYYPLCYLRGYENQISEVDEISRFHTIHLAPDFKNFDVGKSRRDNGRTKTEKCQECKHYKICEGIWKEYLKRYGDCELKPQ